MTEKTDLAGPWKGRGPPAEVTSFVGRRRELADVKNLLSKARLVTLTGVGGVGKTRLAYRVAAETRRAFPDGVWVVELAELHNPGLLAHTVCEALRIDEHAVARPEDVLAEHLSDLTALIVLDNCEHLAQECAVLTEVLLRAAPRLRILATSRHVLGMTCEQTLTVLPLALPDPGGVCGESSVDCEAVQLFTERAQAVVPGFMLDEHNKGVIEQICRRLDGIPLAIELAVPRLRALSLAQLLERLDDRFRLLERGSSTGRQRHRTLWALIDWSHALCTPQERLLWARSSVFTACLDLEGAEAVCSGDGIAREDVLDLVSGLVDKSVLARSETRFGVRYRVLESLQRYGRDRLAESGEETAVLRRYRAYYRRLCADTRERMFGPGQVALLARMRLENPNLRRVIDQCFSEPGEAVNGLRMAVDLRGHWLSGYLGEGRQRLDEGLAVHRSPDEVRGRALVLNAWLVASEGRLDPADAMLDEAETIGGRLGHEGILADVTLQRGVAALDRSHTDIAVARCADAVARHRRTGDLTGRARAHLWLSAARTFGGDLAAAVAAAEEGIALCDAHGETLYRAYLTTMLGMALWCRGDTARAGELAKESLAHHRSLENPRGIGMDLALMAWVAASQGRYERAARVLETLHACARGPRARAEVGADAGGFRYLRRYHEQTKAAIRHAIGDAGFAAATRESGRLDVDAGLAYAMEESDGEGLTSANGEAPSPLTRRETEVARLVGRGLTNKDIAAELVISQRTAEGHVEHILNKLGFGSRAQIAVWINNAEGASVPGAGGYRGRRD
jgi:predicted ATPase/DNA-binding CsgD family transcriptional regulator